MERTALHSISAVDGRYWSQTEELSHYFSEYALIRYRLHIEVEYFIALCELPLPQLISIDKSVYAGLRNVVSAFNDKDASAIKDIEKVTNHDVKAVEYFLRDKFDELGISAYKEFIHFGLTSQDINNTAVPLSYKVALNVTIIPAIEKTVGLICHSAQAWKEVSLGSR